MKKGERIQYACGHWLTAGHYGIKDDDVKDVPSKRCGSCLRRIERAAEGLLVALEGLGSKCIRCGAWHRLNCEHFKVGNEIHDPWIPEVDCDDECNNARKAIRDAKP